MIHVLIFIAVNAAICCLVQFMTYYSTRGYIYSWYIGFSFFVIVLCQIIATVIVLTESIKIIPVLGIAVATILLTGT